MGEESLSTQKRILIVDDDNETRQLMEETLLLENYLVHATYSAKKAIALLQEWHPDVLISDVNMPEMSGLDLVNLVRRQISYVSFILVSGNTQTTDVIRGLDAGADDYICKPFDPRELLARVRAQIRVKEVNDRLLQANARLAELIDIDDLTGLFNMRSLYQRLEHELERGRRFNRSVCVVMMDMDYFKNVNDAHNHLFGSFALAETGRIIRNNIRSVDFGARYGGDEFLIVLTEVNVDGAQLFCERLRAAIRDHTFSNGEDSMRLTASLGFAITESGNISTDARGLVKLADRALYEAKAAGRNCTRHCDLSVKETLQSIPEALKRKSAVRVR